MVKPPASTMDDVQLLLEQLQQLKADNEQLREQLQQRPRAPDSVPDPVPGPSTSQPSLPPVNELQNVYVYAPRERKCPRFTGKLSVDLLTAERWVEEVRRCLEIRHMSRAEQVLFVMDHLDGSAKAEVHFHPSISRDTPEKIFAIVIENYSCTQSYIAAQLQFFQRSQREGESLRDYSHALKSLMDVVIGKTPGGVPNSDVVLRDQFIEHIHDDTLRRELRKEVLEAPDMLFVNLRGIALRWGETSRHGGKTRSRAFSCDTHCQVIDGVEASTHAVAAKPSDDILEIKECLRRQQAQLDTIMKHISTHGIQSSQSGVSQIPTSSKPFRFQADGKPICQRCNRAGHIARFCRLKPSGGKPGGGFTTEGEVHSQMVEGASDPQLSGNEGPLVPRARHQEGDW